MVLKFTLQVVLLFFAIHALAVPEALQLEPSPTTTIRYDFKSDEKIEDYAISNTGKEILALISSNGKSSLRFFKRIGDKIEVVKEQPFDEHLLAVVASPRNEGQWFFTASAKFDKGPWKIWSLDKDGVPKEIHRSDNALRRLVISSRTFQDYHSNNTESFNRLFFSIKTKGIWQMQSVSENGDRPFVASLIKPHPTIYDCPKGTKKEDALQGDGCTQFASSIVAPKGALPLSFNPNGDFSFESGDGCRGHASFGGGWYGSILDKCQTPIFIHPNGKIFWSWNKATPGIKVEGYPVKNGPKSFFDQHKFIMPPVFFPDGRGVVGLEVVEKRTGFVLIPLADPVAKIFNLWRFSLPDNLLNAVVKDNVVLTEPVQGKGLLGSDPRMHSAAYERARYFHDVYDWIDYTNPDIPNIVTTDPFWYTVGLGMEAAFTYAEINSVIPSYRAFLTLAKTELGQKKNLSKVEGAWLRVISNSLVILDPKPDQKQNADVIACLEGKEEKYSADLLKNFNFAICKPRSHYTLNPELSKYWMSFQYLVLGTSYNSNDGEKFETSLLNSFPKFSDGTLTLAQKWVSFYQSWIAPSTFPGVLEKDPKKRWSVHHPFRKCGLDTLKAKATLSLFPLGWGQDDEIMCEILNLTRPGDSSVVNPNVTEWASAFAGDSELGTIFKHRDDLPWKKWKDNSQRLFEGKKNGGLYETYITGIRTDLRAFEAKGIFQNINQEFLKVKSSLSAIGGWTQLKHTVQLVSETPNAAEGGQGGLGSFEIMEEDTSPGAVEPRPEVFRAQKQVVDIVIALTSKDAPEIVEQLRELSDRLKSLIEAAELQKQGKPLTTGLSNLAKDIGGFLDHKDLFFNGTMQEGYSISRDRESMGLIASVSQANGKNGYTATGNPLMVIFCIEEGGKNRLVLGATYSTYSIEDAKYITDREWRKMQHPLPEWVTPYYVP